MQCDTEGCPAEAVTVLRFRNTPGHVHVCAPHDAVDREWCDVIDGQPMPCPSWLRCMSGANVLQVAAPPLL